MANPTVNIIVPYTVVEEYDNFETMWRNYKFGNTIASFLERRSVHTIVYEAVLADGSAYPGSRNPGNLDTTVWMLGSVRMSSPRGQLLQRIVREVWSKKGEWEVLQ